MVTISLIKDDRKQLNNSHIRLLYNNLVSAAIKFSLSIHPPDPHEITFSKEEIRQQLERIVRSEDWGRGKLLRGILRYCVTNALDGKLLKEYSIAVDVFGKPTTFDPGTDSSIRVRMKDFRRKLASYYEGPGKKDRIYIHFVPGSYTPLFLDFAAIKAQVVIVLEDDKATKVDNSAAQ